MAHNMKKKTSPPYQFDEPKAAQLQVTTHDQIINVGQQVFQKEIDAQQRIFNETLRNRENELRQQYEIEKENALQLLRDEQALNIQKVKEESLRQQDRALKSEARRVEAIMKKNSSVLIEERIMEGQKKLEEALFKARENFDQEKDHTIRQAIRQQEKIAAGVKLKEDETQSRKIIELNAEWQNKIEEALRQLSVDKDAECDAKQQAQQADNEKFLQAQMEKQREEHALVIESWKEKVNEQLKIKADLEQDIQNGIDRHHDLEAEIARILKTFQSFVDSVPVFSGEDGQSDFLLCGLMPDLNKFGLTPKEQQ